MFWVLPLTEGHTQRGCRGSQVLPQGLCMCFLYLSAKFSPDIHMAPTFRSLPNFTSSVRCSLTVTKLAPQRPCSQHWDQCLAHRKQSKMIYIQGHLSGSVVEHLPLAQAVIPGSWDRVRHPVPRREPASPSAYVSASLCVSLMNKKQNKTKKAALPPC